MIALAHVRWRPLVPSLLAAALSLASSACGNNGKELQPVEGKIICDGKPATRAIVWLHPVDKVEPSTPRPHGTVDKDGFFKLSTYEGNDGAPAGKYRLAVFWKAPGNHGDKDGESLLPAHYMNPNTSGLPTVEIKEGSNRLHTIVLNQ
jgi:hypothetical protein